MDAAAPASDSPPALDRRLLFALSGVKLAIEENHPIFVCRGLRVPLGTLWPRLKKWN